MEKEEFLFLNKASFKILSFFLPWAYPYLSDLTVITFSSFFNELFVLGHLLFIRERNTIDTLKGIILGITQKV